jgi:hypothetical protein
MNRQTAILALFLVLFAAASVTAQDDASISSLDTLQDHPLAIKFYGSADEGNYHLYLTLDGLHQKESIKLTYYAYNKEAASTRTTLKNSDYANFWQSKSDKKTELEVIIPDWKPGYLDVRVDGVWDSISLENDHSTKCFHGQFVDPLGGCHNIESKYDPELNIQDALLYTSQQRLMLPLTSRISADLTEHTIDIVIDDKVFSRPIKIEQSVPAFYTSQNPMFVDSYQIEAGETIPLNVGLPDGFVRLDEAAIDVCGKPIIVAIFKGQEMQEFYKKPSLACTNSLPVCGDNICSLHENLYKCSDDCAQPINLVIHSADKSGVQYSFSFAHDSCTLLFNAPDGRSYKQSFVNAENEISRLEFQKTEQIARLFPTLGTGVYSFSIRCDDSAGIEESIQQDTTVELCQAPHSTAEKYCNAAGELLPKKEIGESCTEREMCRSNLCSSVCKPATFWNKILRFVRLL